MTPVLACRQVLVSRCAVYIPLPPGQEDSWEPGIDERLNAWMCRPVGRATVTCGCTILQEPQLGKNRVSLFILLVVVDTR